MDSCLSLESRNKQEVLAGKLNGERRHEVTVKSRANRRLRWVVA